MTKNWKVDFIRAFCNKRLIIGALIFPICDIFAIWAEAWYELSVFKAFDWASNGNFSGFTPAIVAIAYAHSYCSDLQNHFLRYHLIRSRLRDYVLSKIVCCALSSGTMIFVGRAISMLLFSIRYPWYYEDMKSNSPLVAKLVSEGKLLLLILIVLCPVFLKGAFYGAMAFMVSTWIPNLFVVSVIPIALETVVVNFVAIFPNVVRYISPNMIFNWENGVFTSIMVNAIYSICFVGICIYCMFLVSHYEVKRRFENG